MAPQDSGSRRVFLIEFMAEDDPIVNALDNIVAQMTKLVEHIEIANKTTNQFSGDAQKSFTKMGRGAQSMSTQWTSSLVAVGAVYVWLKHVIGGMITKSYELNKIVARSTLMFNAAGVSASNLAGAYLDMGRNAASFMKASVLFERAGVRSTESLKQITKAAWQMGNVIGVSTERAAESLANLGRRLNLTADQMRRAASAAAAMSQQINASSEAILSVSDIAPGAVKTLKLETDVLYGLTAAFERAGMKGAQAGTQLSELLTKLASPIEAWRLNVLGLDSAQLKHAMQTKNVAKITELMTGVVGKNADAWADRMRSMHWATEQEIAMFMNLSKQSKQVALTMNTAMRAHKDWFTLTKLFNLAVNSLVEQLKLLWEEVGAVATKIGMFLAPIISMSVMLLRSLVAVLHVIPTPIVGFVGALGVLAITLFGGIFLFSKLVKILWRLGAGVIRSSFGLKSLRDQFSKLNKTVIQSNWHLVRARNALLRADYANAAKYVKQLAWAKVKLAFSTTKATIAQALESAIVKKSIFLTGMLKSAKLGLVWVEKLLIIARKQGVIAMLGTVAASFLQVLGFKSAAIALLGYAGASGVAAGATRTFSAAIYSIPVIGWIALAITLLGTALYVLYKALTSTSESIKSFGIVLAIVAWPLTLFLGMIWAIYKVLQFLGRVVYAVFSGIGDALLEIGAPLQKIAGMFRRMFNTFAELFMGGAKEGETFFEMIRRGVKEAIVAFDKVWPFITTWVKAIEVMIHVVLAVFAAVYEAIQPLIGVFKELWSALATAFGPLMRMMKVGSKDSGQWKDTLKLMAMVIINYLVPVIRIMLIPLVQLIRMITFFVNAIVFITKLFKGDWAGAMEMGGRKLENLKSIFLGFQKSFQAFGDVMLSPFKELYRLLGVLGDKVISFFDVFSAKVAKVANALKPLLKSMKALGDAGGWIKKKLFGSGFLHITDGVAEALPSMRGLAGSFGSLGNSIDSASETTARMLGLLHALAMRGVIPATTGAPLPAPMAATARAGVVTSAAMRALMPSPPGVVAEGGGAAGGGGAEIVIPVTLMMDGQAIASAVARVSAEDLIRHGNTPMLPMRGVSV